MFRLSALVGVGMLAMVVFVSSGASQGKDDKVKGFLPPFFKNLNLTAAQKESIYKIQKETKDKLQELEDKKGALKAGERTEIMKILNEDQKKQYLQILSGEDTTKKKTDK